MEHHRGKYPVKLTLPIGEFIRKANLKLNIKVSLGSFIAGNFQHLRVTIQPGDVGLRSKLLY